MKVGRRGADGSPAGGAAFPGLRRAAYLREGSHNSHLTVLRQMLTLRSQPISNLGSLAMPPASHLHLSWQFHRVVLGSRDAPNCDGVRAP